METVYVGNTLINDIFLGSQRMDDVLQINQGLDQNVRNFALAANISDSTIINSLDTLVSELKSNNLWNKFYALYPLVGGTADSCKWNLISTASFTVNYTGSFNFTSTGLSGSGITSNINTTFTPSVNSADWATNNSFGVYVNTNVSGGIDMGAESPFPASPAAADTYLSSRYSGDVALFFNSSSLSVASTDSRGFWFGCVSGSSGTNMNLYKNGTSIASKSSPTTYTITRALYFTANNPESGPNANDRTRRQYSLSFIARAFNSTEASTLYNIIQSFQTSLGRNV
jgi:hypothetical protein